MANLSRAVKTFPSTRIPSESGGLAVEVSLIAQLGHGAGDHLFASVSARQREHEAFIDELDEPSAKLHGTDFARGDATSLYSFVVGPRGHPFHRHTGHRVFTAISGSAGAQLRFCTASDVQVAEDPRNFLRALRFVNIPPDCMFTVRFGGSTWHQFAPLRPGSPHPVFVALSCHTNELGGDLPEPLREKVLANEASIPSLTELLPAELASLLSAEDFDPASVPAVMLALDAPAGTIHRTLCNAVRGIAGRVRGLWAMRARATGYLSFAGSGRRVTALSAPPEGSLLREQFAHQHLHHEDVVMLQFETINARGMRAEQLLAGVLEGFLNNAPANVGRMMLLRNALVRPLGLRTSTLGCPVSSLLSPDRSNLFAGRYPVLDQLVKSDGRSAQVILGANDKHLQFRSSVEVQALNDHQWQVTLGTRVRCRNLFGRFYMASINLVHRNYIAPTMLRFAAEYALGQDSVTITRSTMANRMCEA